MKHLLSLGISLLAVFAPIRASLLTVLVLVLADLLLGIWAAWKRSEKITSSGLRRTATKLLVYELLLVLGFLAEHYLIGAAMPVMKIVSAFVGITELLSCVENLNSIAGGNLLASLLTKLNSPSTK